MYIFMKSKKLAKEMTGPLDEKERKRIKEQKK